jgi:isoaspartyl peptidase/L-asparaginase-like protein (Ntn-hydrolase superfamily)
MPFEKGHIIVIAHGGVGSPVKLKNGTYAAAKEALRVIKKTKSPLKAAVAGAVVMENDPRFNAGYGSYFRLDGKSIEMDAAVMDSDNYLAAIASIQNVKNPIKVAYALLDTPHTFLCGSGATRFARLKGFPEYDPYTPKARKIYLTRKKQILADKMPLWALENWSGIRDKKYMRFYLKDVKDTIGVIATDGKNNFAAAGSTGGTSLMLPGRIGDTPLVGSGFFVGKYGAVIATGVGEEITKKMLSREVYEKIKDGMSPQEACDYGLSLFPGKIPVGVVAIAYNNYGIAANKQMAVSVLSDDKKFLLLAGKRRTGNNKMEISWC